MTALRAKISVSMLLASAGLVSLSAAAQPGPAPETQAWREITITGAAGEPPVVVYGAPDAPLAVSFDRPLRTDGGVTIPGADVRLHPFLADTFVITPSKTLAAARHSVPVSVPLADGVVDLTLAFSPAERDVGVRVVRRAISAPPVMTVDELKEMLSLRAGKLIASGACASAPAVSPWVKQEDRFYDVLICDGGSFAYLRVNAPTKCVPVAARMTRAGESTQVLLLRETAVRCRANACWLVAAWMPPGDGRGFALELLAKDGVACHSLLLNLKPSSR